MNLLIQRDTFTDTATLGKLYIDGVEFCNTLEDTMREKGGATFPSCKVQNETAIPVGVYTVVIDFSPHFKKELPHILDVPCYEGVRIHAGNSPQDSSGCILVGQTRRGNDEIGNSLNAFNALFAVLERAYDKGDPITLTIFNGVGNA